MKSYRHPAATWKPSPNFFVDRHGHDMAIEPAWVVLHTMVGTEAAAWGRFQQASQQASSHYGVKLDGSIVQYVDEKDGAWTDGTNVGVGAHDDSVTIEHEDAGDYDGPRTPALYRTSALLVRGICQRYGIPIDRVHVIKHRECTAAATACPDALDVDRIVRMAAGQEPLPGDTLAPPTPPGGRMFIPYPDGVSFGEIYSDGDGRCRWGIWTGGAGQFEGFAAPLTVLGSPQDANDLIECTGVHSTFQGVLRLNIRGVRADGSRWIKVMNASSAALITDWRKSASTPDQFVPVVQGEPGPVDPPGPVVTDAHIAEVAAAEIEKRVGNG